MTTTVFVDGQEGTTGLRNFEYLAERDDIEVLRIAEAQRKDVAARRELINASDITFLCLPDTASRESAALVENDRTCVIDASTAFRTVDDWAYGLPELNPGQRERIRSLKRIAVPGCHASAFILAAAPLVAAGLVPRDYPLSSYSITGYSGGGKKMIAEYEAANQAARGGVASAAQQRLNSPRAYALGLAHKHLPEMAVRAGLSGPPVFTPVVANFYKGLAVTTYFHAQQLGGKLDAQAFHACLAEYYAGETYVKVAPLDHPDNLDEGFFDVQGCNDTNRVDLFVFGDHERLVTIARLDNLGKGASGAAIQCMNLHIGAPETRGLGG
jgi:N-acetyl-gamma-glutamyl-phosphate reductase